MEKKEEKITRKNTVSLFNNKIPGIPFLYKEKKDEDDGDGQIRVGYVNSNDIFGIGFCDLKRIVYGIEDLTHSVDDLCEDYIDILEEHIEEQYLFEEHNDENDKNENNNKNTNENNNKIDENTKINYKYKDIFKEYTEKHIFSALRATNIEFSEKDTISDTNTIKEDFARFGFDFKRGNEELKIILRRMECEKSELYYIAKLCQIIYENDKNKNEGEIIREAIEEFKKFIISKTKLMIKVRNDFENMFMEIYPKIIDKNGNIQDKKSAKKGASERCNKLYRKYSFNKLVEERETDYETNGVAATETIMVLINEMMIAEEKGEKTEQYRQLIFEVVAKQAADLDEIANVIKKVELLIARSRQNNCAKVSSEDVKKINIIAEHAEYINNIKKNKELKKIKKIDEEIRKKINENELSEKTKSYLGNLRFKIGPFIDSIFSDKINNSIGVEKTIWEEIVKNVILVTREYNTNDKLTTNRIPDIFINVAKNVVGERHKIFDKVGKKVQNEVAKIVESIREYFYCIKTEEKIRIEYAEQLSHEKVKIREEAGMGDIMLGDGVTEQQQRRINEHSQLSKENKDFKKASRFNELDLKIDAKYKAYIKEIEEYNKKIEELSKSNKHSGYHLQKIELPKLGTYKNEFEEKIRTLKQEQEEQTSRLTKYYTSKQSSFTDETNTLVPVRPY